MKKLISAALAASALIATPVLAQESTFTGPRVGVTVGTTGDDFVDFDNQTVGVEAGYDYDIGRNMIAGVGAEYQTDLGDNFFDVSETALLARLGTRVGQRGLVYANGGYTHVSRTASPFEDGADGYRLGVGGELAIGPRSSLKVEQRYLDYGHGVDGFQTVAGLAFRF